MNPQLGHWKPCSLNDALTNQPVRASAKVSNIEQHKPTQGKSANGYYQPDCAPQASANKGWTAACGQIQKLQPSSTFPTTAADAICTNIERAWAFAKTNNWHIIAHAPQVPTARPELIALPLRVSACVFGFHFLFARGYAAAAPSTPP